MLARFMAASKVLGEETISGTNGASNSSTLQATQMNPRVEQEKNGV